MTENIQNNIQNNIQKNIKKIRKAVIPAAGLGTRFLPATKVIPKELMPVVDRPAIQYIVEEAVAAGIEEIILVISKGKESVLQHFLPHPALEAALTKKGDAQALEKITFFNNKVKFTAVYQNEPRGLGDAVLKAKEAVGNEWFFVFLPDDLIDAEVPAALQMVNSYNTHGGPTVAVLPVPWESVSSYGVVKAHPISPILGKVESVVEKPRREVAPSNLAIIGRYLLPPEIFGLIEQVTPGAIGEIQLTDALLKLTDTLGLYAFQFEGTRYDTGNKIGFLQANIGFAMNDETLKPKLLELLDTVRRI